MKLSLFAATVCGLIGLSNLHAAEALPSQQGLASAPQSQTMPSTLPRAVIEQAVRGMGLDPASEKGQVAGRWFERSFLDADLRALLYQNGGVDLKASGDKPVFPAGARLQPEQRLMLVKLFADYASTLTKPQCQALFASQKGDNKLLELLSARQLDELMKVFDVLLHTAAHAQGDAESYPIDQVLRAESDVEERVEAALKRQHIDTAFPSVGDPPGKSNTDVCVQMTTLLRTVLQTPEPTRRVVTWDLLSAPWSGTVFEHVLRKPDQFLTSHFDLGTLPAGLQQRLPAPGSRPLEYTKIVIAGDEENSTAHEKSTAYEETYWNLRDTGLVNRLGLNHPERPVYGYLSTEYGYQSIRAQPISGSVRYPTSRLLAPDAYPILDNGGPIPEPNSVYLSPPLQRDSGAVQGSRCESFEKYPASQVFKDFTGDAVDVSCKSMSDKAVTYQNREAYLYDYGISVRLFEINEDGLSVSRIREVSITR